MSGFTKTVKTLPRTFWAANTLELFERWAYYGLFNLLALYLTNSSETGALGFSQVEKGMIMGIVNAILYFLPIITGSIADKFGYKKVLIIAFVILSSGYYVMGIVTSFAAVFLAFLYVAIGAALFKPIISATIAKTTNESNSSIGFGIFYMIVNIGGLVGPFTASYLREINWNYIFLMSSGAILLNLVIVIIFFKEPVRDNNSESLAKSLGTVFKNIFTVLKDFKFVTFLLIIVGAWTVYWQYFYSLPVFIEQWVDTAPLYRGLYSIWPAFAKAIGTLDGLILTEKIIAMDAFFIVAFQVIISYVVMKLRPLSAMTIGILINSLGLVLMVLTRNPFFALTSIIIFSIGEMTFSPKILEYIGRIAPKDKAALYMGTQFLPIALGNFFGGFISGGVYLNLSDKYEMIKRMLPELNSLNLTNEQLTEKAISLLNTDSKGLTDLLWNTYHPYMFGTVLFSIGTATVILLYFYDRKYKKEVKSIK
ncbi:MAG: MFS transporter [Bacteroidia bacterium]|nr:MFS transporter [Bacteroidia bacterium]